MASVSSSSSSSPSSRGARVSRKLHLLALAAASIHSASAYTISGCYSSSKPLAYSARWNFQSPSWCNTNCAGSAVFGLEGGYNCWCGSELPAADTQVDDSNCDVPCTGYGQDACGGTGFYTVYITGTDPGNYEPPSNGGGGGNNNNNNNDGSSSAISSNPPSPTSSTPASTSSSAPSSLPPTSTSSHHDKTTIIRHRPTVITKIRPGKTVVETVPPSTISSSTPTSDTNSSSSSSNSDSSNNSGSGTPTAAIAAGVSIGVVGLAAIVGGLIYWLHRRRRQQTEGAFDRSNRVGKFIRGPSGGGTGPPSTGYSQMSDSRLEPQWGNNRSSVGSFLDNEDYSRRILRVANPDSG